MKEFLVGAFLGVFVALLGVAIYNIEQESKACEAKGGVLLDRHAGCVKLERIK